MPDRHKGPLVGWHPPAELVARIQAEVDRRGGGRGVKSEVLNEAVARGLDAMGSACGKEQQT